MNKGIQMKIFATVVIVIALCALMVFVTGCSGQARTDYYEAVGVSSLAHSNTQIAKFNALRDMAQSTSGDSSAAVAAVMALALMRQETIRPAYIEDETLSWAKALAGPLTGVAALLIQADLSSENNKQQQKTARAAIDAQTTEQGALLDALTTDTGSGATTDLAIAGIVDISTAAIDASTITSGNSIDGVVDVAGQSIDGVVDISIVGYDTIENVVIDENLTTLGIADILQPVVVTP